MKFLGALIFLNHWRILHKFFGTVRKKQSTESWYLIIQKLFDTISFQKHKDPPTKFFGTVRQKGSTESWYPYYPKNLETRISLNHRRVRPRWFLAMWDKKFRKIVIPLLSKKFWYQKISETQKGRPRRFSAIWDQKTSTDKRNNPYLFKNFFRTGTFLKDNSVPPTKLLGTVRLKLSTENRWTPLLCIVFLGALIFLNHWRVLHKFFGTVRKKQSTESWYLIVQKLFDTIRFQKNKDPPTKFFGTVRQKGSTESWYPCYPKLFDTRIILKHRRVRSRWFLAMWDKKVDKIVMTPLSKKFWNQNNSETQKGSPTMFFMRFGTKKLRRQNVTTPSYP